MLVTEESTRPFRPRSRVQPLRQHPFVGLRLLPCIIKRPSTRLLLKSCCWQPIAQRTTQYIIHDLLQPNDVYKKNARLMSNASSDLRVVRFFVMIILIILLPDAPFWSTYQC